MRIHQPQYFRSRKASGIEVTDLPDDKAESQASNGENLEHHRTYCHKDSRIDGTSYP